MTAGALMDFVRSLVGFTLFAVGAGIAAHAQQTQQAPHWDESMRTTRGGQSQIPQARLANPSPDAPDFMELAKGKGYITRADIPKNEPTLDQLRLHFNEADTDHNGRVDEREYGVYLIKMNPGRR
ncbi:hypothetical protein KCV01_g18385, partial [Aureobasidium melanogenum]